MFLSLSVAADLDTGKSRFEKNSVHCWLSVHKQTRALIVDTTGMFSKLQPPEYMNIFPCARFGILNLLLVKNKCLTLLEY